MNPLALDLALRLDPSAIFRAGGIVPDPWQTTALSVDRENILLLCSRQVGKSTTSAALALRVALTEPGALILLLSPSLRQSQELFRKVTEFYKVLGRPIEPEAESTLRMDLSNGSRILSLPGREETIRGYSGARLIIIDEASRVADDLYYSVRPMLAVSRGNILALSTPFGKIGWYFKEWEDGEGWHKIRVTARDCPRISPEFLEAERRALGLRWFNQEYMCDFIDAVGAVFTDDMLKAFIRPDVQALEL